MSPPSASSAISAGAGSRRRGPYARRSLTRRPATPAGDQRKAERSLGDPAAKVTVQEFFSLTCTHCAAFAQDTMPEVEKDLIAPGKVRFVYHDFPLDQVALTAAMVARYLPPAQYYPFVSALFANQDRWAFARGVNTTDEIWKLAALAGMSRPPSTRRSPTPTCGTGSCSSSRPTRIAGRSTRLRAFVINDQKYAGEMNYEAFRKLLPEV